MYGLETNLKSTRPRPGHYERKTETETETEILKIGLEIGLETFITGKHNEITHSLVMKMSIKQKNEVFGYRLKIFTLEGPKFTTT